MSQHQNIIKRQTLARRTTVSPLKPLAGEIIKAANIQAQAEAKAIVENAELYAKHVRAGIDELARRTQEAAYAEGYEKALGELSAVILDSRETRDAALATLENDVLRLAVKLAEKIIGHQLEQSDETIASIVATAMQHARQNETVTIHVNPNDMRAVDTHRARWETTGRARFVQAIPDARVAAGGCLIETESGTIDAQLETQLRVLERALLSRAAKEERL